MGRFEEVAPGVVEISRTEGDGVGTRYHQTGSGPGGRSVPADIVIDAFEPDRVITCHTTTGPVRFRGRYEIAELGNGSSVVLTLTAELIPRS